MCSNPYISTHFGGSMDFFRNSRQEVSNNDEFDAATGFSRFLHSKHMTTSVFKPSKPAAPSKPDPVNLQTPPDNVFKLRNRFLMNRFPSRPTTPGSSPGAGLPPLLPSALHAAAGMHGDGVDSLAVRESTADATPTGETQSSLHSEDDTDGDRGGAAVAAGLHGFPTARDSVVTGLMRANPAAVESCTPPASEPAEQRMQSANGRQWMSHRSPLPRPVTAFLSATTGTNPPQTEGRGNGDAQSVHTNEDGVSDVSPPSEGSVVSPRPRTTNGNNGKNEPPSSHNNSEANITGECPLSPTALARAPAGPALKRGASLETATERYAVPPPLPAATVTDGVGGEDERAPAPATITAASPNHPASPLHDDDFSQFLSPASDVPPREFPASHGNATRDGTAVPAEAALPPNRADGPARGRGSVERWQEEGDGERRLIATLCSQPSQQAERCLRRRRRQLPPASEGHGGGAQPTGSRLASSLSHPQCAPGQLVEGLESLAVALRATATESKVERSGRHRSKDHHADGRRREGDRGERGTRGRSRRHKARTPHRGRLAHNASTSADPFADLLMQLRDFLHGGAPAQMAPAHAPVSVPQGPSAHRDHIPQQRPTTHPAASPSGERAPAAPQPQAAAGHQPRRELAQPVVLAGHRPSQISLLSRRTASRSRSTNATGAPSYALPTESWLHKNVEDGAGWLA